MSKSKSISIALFALLAAWVAGSGAAFAQDSGASDRAVERQAPDGPASDEKKVFLDADAFRALFEGKTIHVFSKGRYFGSEYYPKGDRAIWVPAGRPCIPGVWTYEKPHICFRYEGSGPHCWSVFQRGEKFYALSVDGFELSIDLVEEKPLSCAPELLS